MAHLVPAVVTVPVVALTVNALVAAGQDVYIEGLFLLLMLLLLVLALQVLLAVGLLIGGVFAWSRGKRRLATGLGIGWLVGVAAVMLLGSCTPAAMAAFGR